MPALQNFDLVMTRARAFAHFADDELVRDSREAMTALAANELYGHALVLFQAAVSIDELLGHKTDLPGRSDALDEGIRFFEKLEAICVRTKPEERGYDASAAKARQMTEALRLMRRGVVIYDEAQERTAMDAYREGKTVTLDELRRQLRDRRP